MIVGVDVGTPGHAAIACIQASGAWAVKIPTERNHQGEEVLSARLLADVLSGLLAQPSFCKPFGYIEDPGYIRIPKRGKKESTLAVEATVKLKYALACIESGFLMARFPYQKVAPRTWKAALHLTADKRHSLSMAKKVFPELESTLRLLKDHDLAEAALIAHYGRTQMMETA